MHSSIQILYESNDYLVVSKPFDMYINSNDESEKNTLVSNICMFDSHLKTSSHPLWFIHRLDYATSGVICISKNKSACSKASKLFQDRKTKKYYLAIVRGHVQDMACNISYDIGEEVTSKNTIHKMGAVTDDTSSSLVTSPRSAHTKMLVLERGLYGKDPVTVVLLKPITGRRHQLRVHCASICHTILGDYTYSNKSDVKPHRMFLHSFRLYLPLPDKSLDIWTKEPFLADEKFSSLWHSEEKLYPFERQCDFLNTCKVLDDIDCCKDYKCSTCSCDFICETIRHLFYRFPYSKVLNITYAAACLSRPIGSETAGPMELRNFRNLEFRERNLAHTCKSVTPRQA